RPNLQTPRPQGYRLRPDRGRPGGATADRRLGQASPDARPNCQTELDIGRQRAPVDGTRLRAFLPDAAQRRRARRHQTGLPGNRRAHDIGSSDRGNPPRPLNAGAFRRTRADAGVWPWFRTWVCRAYARGAQSVAGIGRRLFLERRDRDVLLDRSEAGAHCDSPDAGTGATAALPLSHAHNGVSGDHAIKEIVIYATRFGSAMPWS